MYMRLSFVVFFGMAWHCMAWHGITIKWMVCQLMFAELNIMVVSFIVFRSKTFDSIELRRCYSHCLPSIACVFSSNRNTHTHPHTHTYARNSFTSFNANHHSSCNAFYFISFGFDSLNPFALLFYFHYYAIERERVSQLFCACVNYYVLVYSMVFFTIRMSHAFSLTISSRISYFLLNWSCTKGNERQEPQQKIDTNMLLARSKRKRRKKSRSEILVKRKRVLGKFEWHVFWYTNTCTKDMFTILFKTNERLTMIKLKLWIHQPKSANFHL